MKRELIINTFAALQALEKNIAESKNLLSPNAPKSLISSIEQQEQVTAAMRRAANLLQLELAKDNWGAAIRHLRIFYGLNHLVRPEIKSTYSALLNKNFISTTSPLPAHAVVH